MLQDVWMGENREIIELLVVSHHMFEISRDLPIRGVHVWDFVDGDGAEVFSEGRELTRGCF